MQATVSNRVLVNFIDDRLGKCVDLGLTDLPASLIDDITESFSDLQKEINAVAPNSTAKISLLLRAISEKNWWHILPLLSGREVLKQRGRDKLAVVVKKGKEAQSAENTGWEGDSVADR